MSPDLNSSSRYYYRSNYLALFMLSFSLFFLRNPMALLATALTGLGLLCLNDPFASVAK